MCKQVQELGIMNAKENSHTLYDLDKQGVIKMFDIYMQLCFFQPVSLNRHLKMHWSVTFPRSDFQIPRQDNANEGHNVQIHGITNIRDNLPTLYDLDN
jgi:hypothetical protein